MGWGGALPATVGRSGRPQFSQIGGNFRGGMPAPPGTSPKGAGLPHTSNLLASPVTSSGRMSAATCPHHARAHPPATVAQVEHELGTPHAHTAQHGQLHRRRSLRRFCRPSPVARRGRRLARLRPCPCRQRRASPRARPRASRTSTRAGPTRQVPASSTSSAVASASERPFCPPGAGAQAPGAAGGLSLRFTRRFYVRKGSMIAAGCWRFVRYLCAGCSVPLCRLFGTFVQQQAFTYPAVRPSVVHALA